MKVEVKRKLVIGVILSLSIAGMISLRQMRPEPSKKPVKSSAMLVDVLDLSPSDVIFEIKSQGTVKPRTETILSAEVSGRIISISDKFIAGGVFKKDEVLMQIDPTDYQVAVDQSDALLKQRQIEFNGAKSLRNKGYRAEAELAAAKAALASAKASLTRAKKNLDRTKIRLPYDGLVKSKNSDIGQFVNPGSLLGNTFAVNIAEVRLALTDQDLAFLDLPEAGDIAETGYFKGPVVKLSAVRKGQHQRWNAYITRTEGVVDERSRVTYAVAQIEDPYRLLTNVERENDTALPIGTFVSATIMGNSFSNIVVVPRTAIRGKNELIFVDSDNRLQIREVNILRADTEHAYILGGESLGKRISITSIESPINGMKVRTADDIAVEEKVAAGGEKNPDEDTQMAKVN